MRERAVKVNVIVVITGKDRERKHLCSNNEEMMTNYIQEQNPMTDFHQKFSSVSDELACTQNMLARSFEPTEL